MKEVVKRFGCIFEKIFDKVIFVIVGGFICELVRRNVVVVERFDFVVFGKFYYIKWNKFREEE